VSHFADTVTYTAAGWLEKNRGGMPPFVGVLAATANNALLREIFGCCGATPLDVSDGDVSTKYSTKSADDLPADASAKAARAIQARERGRRVRRTVEDAGHALSHGNKKEVADDDRTSRSNLMTTRR
jgi:myosin heavy subunit